MTLHFKLPALGSLQLGCVLAQCESAMSSFSEPVIFLHKFCHFLVKFWERFWIFFPSANPVNFVGSGNGSGFCGRLKVQTPNHPIKWLYQINKQIKENHPAREQDKKSKERTEVQTKDNTGKAQNTQWEALRGEIKVTQNLKTVTSTIAWSKLCKEMD